MENILYLISHNDEKHIVSAKNKPDAIVAWLEAKQDERDQDGNLITFNPNQFKAEELHREELIIRASE